EEHQVIVEVIERVVDSGKSRTHAALDHHYGARLVHIENGHTIDRAAGVAASRRIGDVVGANHQRHVGLRHVGIHVVHVQQFVVGNVRLGEQDVHVSGHAAGNGMDAELHVHAALGQPIIEFAHFV